jgi:hypothetical protein
MKKVIGVLIVLLLVVGLSGCSNDESVNVLNEYIEALKAGEMETIQDLVIIEETESEDETFFTDEDLVSIYPVMYGNLEITLGEIADIDDNTKEIEVSVKQVDVESLTNNTVAILVADDTEIKASDDFTEQFASNMETVIEEQEVNEFDVTITVVKNDEGVWQIENNDELTSLRNGIKIEDEQGEEE